MRKKVRVSSYTWTRRVVSTEGSPVLVVDRDVYATWRGSRGDAPSDYQRIVLDGGLSGDVDVVEVDAHQVAFFDTDGGGAVDVGWNEQDVVVLMVDSDFDDAPTRLAKVVKAIEAQKHPEYLVGELPLGTGIVIADSAEPGVGTAGDVVDAAGPLGSSFFVPRTAGRYLVVEGVHEDERDGWRSRWCRITPHGRADYGPRPAAAQRDPVAEIMARVSFVDARAEARALEHALELITHGRPDLALDICAKASRERRALASWTRILALAARDESIHDARAEVLALAASWLVPATSVDAVNQALPRAHVVRALDAVLAFGPHAEASAMRERVVEAAEPAVFVPDGGDDFF